MSETTDQRQTEIERKLQEQAELLSRPAVPSAEGGQPVNIPQQQAPAWPPPPVQQSWNAQSPPADWNAGGAPPPFVPPPGGYQPYVPVQPTRQPGILERWRAKGGILGTIAAVLMFIAKIGGPLFLLLGKLKFLLIGAKLALGLGSMLVSMWIDSKFYGWPLAVGVVLLIFIHECGHALAAKLRGKSTGIMVFIPMMGAFVTSDRYGKNLEEDAFIGIMGPIVGSLASLACFLIAFPTGNPYWIVLGQWGFFINLFNLLPTPPLDGGWIVPLFSPKLMAIGAVIAVVVGFRNPLIWILLVLSLPRIIGGWKADPKTQPYYQVPLAVKWKYGIAYVGLAALLALGGSFTHAVMVQ